VVRVAVTLVVSLLGAYLSLASSHDADLLLVVNILRLMG
jgi:hypothetical protein